MSAHRTRRCIAPAAALLFGTALAAATACKPRPAAPLPAPRFCTQDLSGVWVNASDVSYAYRLRDQGGQIDGLFFRRSPDGGAVAPSPTEEPMIIELHRTPTALAGVMRSTGLTAGGHRCPVEYGLSVTVCKPGSLQVVSEISVPIDESCKRLRETADGGSDGGEVPSTLAEYLWERPDAGT